MCVQVQFRSLLYQQFRMAVDIYDVIQDEIEEHCSQLVGPLLKGPCPACFERVRLPHVFHTLSNSFYPDFTSHVYRLKTK